MNQAIVDLCHFFDRTIPELKITYSWKIPKITGFSSANQNNYLRNLEFKSFLKTRWDDAQADADRLEIARIIISEWGGVRANREETLIKYVKAINLASPPTPIKGVASYSKLFAIINPEKFAIYDARVAACLNAIQINSYSTKGLAFNYIDGRNNIVGNSNKKIGFTQEKRFSTRELVKSGWSQIRRNETYKRYLDLLSLCLKERPQYSLTSLEMALFSNAEIECKKAMK